MNRERHVDPPQTPFTGNSKSLIRSEWPLLLYPVLVIAALVALYAANRPVRQDPAPQSNEKKQKTAIGRLQNAKDDGSTPANSVDMQAKNGTSRGPGGPDEQQTATNTGRMPLRGVRQTLSPASAAYHPRSAVSPTGNEPPSAGRLTGLLRRAVQTNNQASLKECLDQLVAAGDQSIAPLSDMILNGDDASCVWAAEAIARIGTPAAAQSLLDALSQMKDGPYKEQIAKRASSISNHDSWPVLLDAMQYTEDPVVRRAATASLAQMADAPVVDELVSRYDAATTIDEAAYLAGAVSSINSLKAAGPLLALARQISSAPEDSLDRSIMDAIANVGDPQCVSFLMTKLEASAPGEGAYLSGLIGTINKPQAQASLLYAAAGNKEVSAEAGRTAAILALKNFPDEQTYVLLEQIASTEQNAAVASAAARTLACIQQTQPMLAANAQVKPGEQILLPINPLQK